MSLHRIIAGGTIGAGSVQSRDIGAEASIQARVLAGRMAHLVAPGAPRLPARRRAAPSGRASAYRGRPACFTGRCDRPLPRRVLLDATAVRAGLVRSGRIEGKTVW